MNIDALNPADFKIEYLSGPRTGLLIRPKTGIRITHIPTGVYAISSTRSSPHRNRELAWEDLKKKLVDVPFQKPGNLPEGVNGCLNSAKDALRYLANNPRPSGGEEHFNSIHLFQIADEIESTQRAFLSGRMEAIPEGATHVSRFGKFFSVPQNEEYIDGTASSWEDGGWVTTEWSDGFHRTLFKLVPET